MCGIIGYVGWRDSRQVLCSGLRRLEYRGYDSAGVAWLQDGTVACIRAVGNLDALAAALDRSPVTAAPAAVTGAATATLAAQMGIGHTRWATHGGVSERNAHPHRDATGRIWIVLNGIIENHREIRARLATRGIECASETDAEVVAQLIGLNYTNDLTAAVRESVAGLDGQYALVVMCADQPETLACVRHECPLVLGLGDREQFVASSMAAFEPYTHRVAVLRDQEIAVLSDGELAVYGSAGERITPSTTESTWEQDRIEKRGFESFMLKEIHEQGSAIRDTLEDMPAQLGPGDTTVGAGLGARRIGRIIVVACGTSYHAGLAAKLAIERWARIPVEVEVASEFRYRDPIIEPGTLVLGITQSGETADTLAAMRMARARGATVAAVTNSPGSQATREASAVLYTRAGLEVGVAATKTFVAQVTLLYALALQLAAQTGTLSGDQLERLSAALRSLPEQADEVLATLADGIRRLAEELASSPFFLYLGRLSGLPVALEGSLKLKEISYIPTEAYAAGEMKHGPIALVSARTPVICVATEASVLRKLLSNIAEVKARAARVVAVTVEGFAEIGEYADDVFYLPRTDPLLEVPLAAIPLQLFAYHVARARALSVDQPRNLAKTVTVE